MKLHRFIIDCDFSKFSGTDVTLFDKIPRTINISDPRVVRQIRTVLRFKPGDELILCDGKGMDARMRIVKIRAKTIDAHIESFSPSESEQSVVSILYCAVLKKDSFEWVAQKCTEVGVNSIFPVITKRTIKTSFSSTRLHTIMREASEQSGRGMIPFLPYEPISFEHAMSDAKKSGITVFCSPNASVHIMRLRFGNEKFVNIFIGPEGGWDANELESARECGANIVSLSKTILRAETAAVVASYAIANL